MTTNSTTRTILLGAVAGFAISGALAAGLVIGNRGAATTSQSGSQDDAGVIAPMFIPSDQAAGSEQPAPAPQTTDNTAASGQASGAVQQPAASSGGAQPETPAATTTHAPAPVAPAAPAEAEEDEEDTPAAPETPAAAPAAPAPSVPAAPPAPSGTGTGTGTGTGSGTGAGTGPSTGPTTTPGGPIIPGGLPPIDPCKLITCIPGRLFPLPFPISPTPAPAPSHPTLPTLPIHPGIFAPVPTVVPTPPACSNPLSVIGFCFPTITLPSIPVPGR